MTVLVRVENLKKAYGSQEVLKGISFSVRKGEIFGLLGVNGAGKTTTLEAIEGIRSYDGGGIYLKGKLGVQLQSSSLPMHLKPPEALKLFALWKKGKVDPGLVEDLGIANFANTLYGNLSEGQKRRLHLAIALLNDPDILILDEPTAGLDVEGRAHLHRVIGSLRKQGKAIIIASHDMAEVEGLCDTIAVLKEGAFSFLGSPRDLAKARPGGRRLHFKLSAPLARREFKHASYLTEEKGYAVFQMGDLAKGLSEILAQIEEEAISLIDLKNERFSLEEEFLHMTRQGANHESLYL